MPPAFWWWDRLLAFLWIFVRNLMLQGTPPVSGSFDFAYLLVFSSSDFNLGKASKVFGKRNWNSTSFISWLCFLARFLNLSPINLENGITMRKEVNARLINTFINVEDYVQRPILRSNTSTSVSFCSTLANTYFTKRNDVLFKPSLAESILTWNTSEGTFFATFFIDACTLLV